MSKKSISNKAPFGIGTKRFLEIGYHPAMNRILTITQSVCRPGPGKYNISDAKRCNILEKKELWKRKLESEKWSMSIGNNLGMLAEREFQRTMGGPATQEYNPKLHKRQDDLKKNHRGFGYAVRFPVKENNIPPPDTYYRNIENLRSMLLKSFSNKCLFEARRESRFKEKHVSWHLAPQRYSVIDKDSIEERCSRSHSNKRPLEFFTSERDYKSIKNHFAVYNLTPADTLSDATSCIDYLLYNKNKRSIRELKQSKFPFNISSVHIRPQQDWKISPAVGRYTPKYFSCKGKKGPSWSFLGYRNSIYDLPREEDFYAF
ncbi:uncharacterized protein LOC109606366 isoform X2 [Aethina tumida]|uniref:uncharacterized protein LOC109606366 isoform X2 n=1 Tax=Aethina tumida TaxID=116153 RepID=UPI002148CF99|nr:uncharacterized protein LOC109606366 isoform X2 [Aethina tumida]